MNIKSTTRVLRPVGCWLAAATMLMGSQAVGGERSAAWRFDTAEGSSPEANSGFTGAHCQVNVGANGLAWNQTFPGTGGADGLYDLGQSGNIELSLPNGLVTGPAQLTVKVRQWYDGWIFGQLVSVQVPGANFANTTVLQLTPGNVGGWVTTEWVWDVPPGVKASSVTVTGPSAGAVVDEVSLKAPEAIPVAPFVLTIEPVSGEPGSLELSWPEAAGVAAVESTTDLSDPGSWSPVEGAAELVNDRYTVRTGSSGPVRYFRLHR
jgi:hypothetical protein